MEYRLEDMKLLKDAKGGKKEPFVFESGIPLEEKLAFVDRYYSRKDGKACPGGDGDGAASYMYALLKQFNEEKESMPKDGWGYVKTVSLKAWLRRNDVRGICSSDIRYGEYVMVGTTFLTLDLTDFSTSWSALYDHSNLQGSVVDQWFHDLLVELRDAEIRYRNDHSPLLKKTREVAGFCSRYGGLGIRRIEMIAENCNRFLDAGFLKEYGNAIPVPDDRELDAILDAYRKLEKSVEEIRGGLGGFLRQ